MVAPTVDLVQLKNDVVNELRGLSMAKDGSVENTVVCSAFQDVCIKYRIMLQSLPQGLLQIYNESKAASCSRIRRSVIVNQVLSA